MLAEELGAPVPEEGILPREVEQGHRLAWGGFPVEADREAARIGKSCLGLMAGGAGDGAIAGKFRFMEQAPSEFDTLDRERIVERQIRQRKGSRQGERVGGEGGGKIDGLDLGACGTERLGIFKFERLERCLEVTHELGGQGIAFIGMRAASCGGKRDRARAVDEFLHIENEVQPPGIAQVDRDGDGHAGAVRIAGDMIDVTSGGLVGGFEMTFDGEENVATLPVPVQAIEQRIERMSGGEAGGIGVIGFGAETDIEMQRAERPGWRRGKRKRGSLMGLDKGKFIELHEASVLALQGKIREQVCEAGDGKRFLCGGLIARGFHQQRGIAVAVVDDDF